MPLNVIEHFEGTYAFLSNFYHAPFVAHGLTFDCVERAFLYFSSAEAVDRDHIMQRTLTPAHPQTLGSPIADWNRDKVRMMRTLVRAKFDQHADLRAALLATGNSILINTSRLHDTYWGWCACAGCAASGAFNTNSNRLGEILEHHRATYIQAERRRLRDADKKVEKT